MKLAVFSTHSDEIDTRLEQKKKNNRQWLPSLEDLATELIDTKSEQVLRSHSSNFREGIRLPLSARIEDSLRSEHCYYADDSPATATESASVMPLRTTIRGIFFAFESTFQRPAL